MTQSYTKRPICWEKRHERRKSPLYNIGGFSPPVTGTGGLQKIIDALDKSCVITRGEFHPIMDYKKYIAMLRIANEHPPQVIREIERKHEEYYASHTESETLMWTPGVDLPNLVHSESEINGRQPFVRFNHVPPREALPMYEAAGVSQEVRTGLEMKVTAWEQGHESRNAVLDEVLSKYSGKTQARKKKKSLRSRFVNKVKYIIKDDDSIDQEEGGANDGDDAP